MPDERKASAVTFLGHALAWCAGLGVTVERVMTDNGPAYVSIAHAVACRSLGVRHVRTRSYRPQTNGKAERFIRTMLREWAYAAVYGSSAERAQALPGWLERYNYSRRHGALGQRAFALSGGTLTNARSRGERCLRLRPRSKPRG